MTLPDPAFSRGVVKEVQSGDTLVIMTHGSPGGPVTEKRLSLSNLIAPRMVRSPVALVFNDIFAL
jgi:hypothetical protein